MDGLCTEKAEKSRTWALKYHGSSRAKTFSKRILGEMKGAMDLVKALPFYPACVLRGILHNIREAVRINTDEIQKNGRKRKLKR